MRLLFDFFPILLFFIAYKTHDIYMATKVAIAASVVQVAWFWFRHRRFEKMHLISLAIIIIAGGLTLALQDETFIKWKPTIINWIFGIVFLFTQFIGEKSLAERMMGGNLTLPPEIWLRLNMSWVVFFAAMGLINLYVVYNFDTDTWVNFKLFGMFGLTLAFVLVQAVYLVKFLKPEEDNKN